MKKVKTLDSLEIFKNREFWKVWQFKKKSSTDFFYRFLYNHTKFRPLATTQANMPKQPNGLVAGGRAAWG